MPEISTPNTITKEICDNWMTNAYIKACTLKLDIPTEDEWANDSSRTDYLADCSNLRDWLLPMLVNGQVIVQTTKD